MKVKKWWITGIIIALFMASVLSLFASPEPDGLERVAEDYGFIEKAEGQEVIHAPMPDYTVLGVGNEKIASALAGLIGVLIILVLTLSWAKLLKR
ncbi:MAG: PDGLE domain-containing protein [Candidatus Hadarchaeum sp.]|uniref:PDGLE domain-containing protein n=1 Tax=Candidatus Hadarchaeum sp. TaxID=2883567 RepID=UPI003D1454DD